MDFRGIWKDMSGFRRVMLVLQVALVLVFGIVTTVSTGREGLAYGGGLLYPQHQGEIRCYVGKLDGKQARLTVTPDGVIEYTLGDWHYGPYQVTYTGEDDAENNMLDVQVTKGEEVLFRGYHNKSSFDFIWNADKHLEFDGVTISYGNGQDDIYIENGVEMTEQQWKEPGPKTLIRWALQPEDLTHKGSLYVYFLITLLALMNLVLILFPEAMFRLSLWGHVRNIDQAEPSEWYLFSQGLGWLTLNGLTAFMYLLNLSELV